MREPIKDFKDTCIDCDKPASKRLQRKMKRFYKKQFKYLEYRRKRNEQIANNQPSWKR